MPESILPVTGASPATSIGTVAESASNTSTISSDFETFLVMLTAQLENQDPLNPIESQDFAVQLATFSSVEQQVLTNDLLKDLNRGLGASELSQLAGWVGMEARVTADVNFAGSPVEVAIETDPGSDAAVLVVSDRYGRVVSREAAPLGSQTVIWAGADVNGQPLPPGQYTLSVESMNQGSVTSTREAPHYARIREARSGIDGIELVLEGGAVVSSGGVTALRDVAG